MFMIFSEMIFLYKKTQRQIFSNRQNTPNVLMCIQFKMRRISTVKKRCLQVFCTSTDRHSYHLYGTYCI